MEKNNKRRLLLTAGPVPVSEEIQRVFASPMVYHRSKDFIELYEQVTNYLKYLFQTESNVLILNSSGTGAMEAAVANFFSPGDKVLVAVNGKFSERWKLICEQFKLNVAKIVFPAGKSISAESVLEKIEQIPDLKGVFLTYCETSTGALSDVQKISEAVRESSEALVIVDSISAVPTMPFFMDKWGIDVAIAASQKGLGLPPGLSFVAVSPRAWVAAELAELPRYYFDLVKYRQSIRLQIGSPFTPSVLHVKAALVALEKLYHETLPVIWRKKEKLAGEFRTKIQKNGWNILPENPSNSLTVIDFGDSGKADEIIRILEQQYGIIVSGGQGELRGKVIRVGHMANVEEKDLDFFIKALKEIWERTGGFEKKRNGS